LETFFLHHLNTEHILGILQSLTHLCSTLAVPVPAILQEENERLTYQHQLVAEMCRGFDWFRHVQLHSLLVHPEQVLGDSATEQLTPGSMQQQLSPLLKTELEVQLLQQLSSLPVVQPNISKSSGALPASALNSSYTCVAAPAASPLLLLPATSIATNPFLQAAASSLHRQAKSCGC
jgi:hypothetical protein